MIPFLDLKAEYESVADEIEAAIEGVFQRGLFILGPEVQAFESEFAAYCGVPQAVGVASGTDALHLALRACGIGPGDEVITVSHTAVATVAAVELAGARPVLVDIDRSRYTMDPDQVGRAITPRTRAVLPVHLYGLPAELGPILEIAERHGLRVVEDACQAHGAVFRGRRVGSWGDLGCFSFYPTKNLGGYGDGGMVSARDPALGERVRLLRTYGWQERDRSVMRGMNSRLDELQAAILRVKLRRLDENNRRRRGLAKIYTDSLAGVAGITLPSGAVDCEHAFHLYVVRTERRDELRRFLAQREIGALVHYPTPVHLQEPYRDLGYPPGSLPQSEAAAAQILSLPLSPGISEDQVRTVAGVVREFFES